MAPKITVILTSYNKPRLAGQAIASVFNQTCQDFELILCDDNSNEKTRAVLEKYLQHPKIIYHQTNVPESERYKTCRYATVINQALRKARGQYISYLCDDDIYYPWRLEIMAKTLDENSQYYIVYGAQRLRWLSGTFIPFKKIRQTVGVTWEAAGKIDHNSIMHRKICSDKVGGWDDHKDYWMSADAVFFRRLNQYWPFYPIEEVLDEHRFHTTSVQSAKMVIWFRLVCDKLASYFRKGAGK